MSSDYQAIFEGLRAIVPFGATFEVRLLGTRKGRVDAGYFDNWADGATAVNTAMQNGWYVGAYVTANPVNPDLMARSYNRVTEWMQKTSHDTDVLRRVWLMIDIDPVRPSGISSTDDEHKAAILKARSIAGMLAFCGWPEPMINDSGNGCHLMYPINEPNDNETRDLIQMLLKVLNVQFGSKEFDIDTSVFNAARIWRIPGTWSRKGDSTPGRPHRQSAILSPLRHTDKVTREQIIDYVTRNKALLDKVPGRVVNGANGAKYAHEYPADEAIYRRLNDAAKQELGLKAWVPHFFPSAREYKQGYRVTSEDLGLHFEEDLTIHPPPLGIKYMGIADQGDETEGRRTPISLIAEFCFDNDKKAAAAALANLLMMPLNEFMSDPLRAVPAQVATAQYGAAGGDSAGLMGLLGTPEPQFDINAGSALSLFTKKFAAQKWVVENRIPVGSMLLASDPKVGKTWFGLQMADAIASGGTFLGYPVAQGEVLYLGLEDTERRMQARLQAMRTFKISKAGLENFHYLTGGMTTNAKGNLVVQNQEEYKRAHQLIPRGVAGIEALKRYKDAHPNLRAIFIDTLVHMRDTFQPGRAQNAYTVDYEDLEPIRKLANDTETLILSLHHLRKSKSDIAPEDKQGLVSGSMAMTGATDGYMILTRKQPIQSGTFQGKKSASLFIDGRDVRDTTECDLALDPERGGWIQVQGSTDEQLIVDILLQYPNITQREIADMMGRSQPTVSRMLTRMKLNYIIIEHKGIYRVPEPQERARAGRHL